jgi:hypothetical protein
MFGRKRARLAAADPGTLDLRAQVSDSFSGLGELPEQPGADNGERREMAPSARDLQAEIDESERELVTFMDELNSSWTGGPGSETELRPFFMLPARCWDTEHQRVLIETLGLTPAQQWNVLPLASGSNLEGLDLAHHPGGVTTDVIEMASGFVDDTIVEMHAAFERATFTGDTVDTEALGAAREKARTEVMALARRIGASVIGDDAVIYSRDRFFND